MAKPTRFSMRSFSAAPELCSLSKQTAAMLFGPCVCQIIKLKRLAADVYWQCVARSRQHEVTYRVEQLRARTGEPLLVVLCPAEPRRQRQGSCDTRAKRLLFLFTSANRASIASSEVAVSWASTNSDASRAIRRPTSPALGANSSAHLACSSLDGYRRWPHAVELKSNSTCNAQDGLLH